MKKLQIILLSSILLSIQTLNINCTNKKGQQAQNSKDSISENSSSEIIRNNNSANEFVDFVSASKAVTPAVVHIKTISNASSSGGRSLYGSPSGRSAPVMGSASGVLITSDGYIATNNHVVENASKIEVILPDKRRFTAKLIGRDPNTDLALIKVDGTGLPTVKFGNSDIVEVGEWVIAVGYPFSLNTTVTAGIISAKARSIGIISQSEKNNNQAQIGNSAVESFIQTDAAINPGNSGGALVNTRGELIGINSAIASQTGSYAGYAFAIPVNLAKKILDDIKKYGEVRRGVLGVSFPAPAVEDQYFAQQGLSEVAVKGVYITGVLNESAAALGGLKEGDIIKSIDGLQLSSSSQFSEMIARHEPGDVIKLSYMRNGKEATTSVTLKSEQPTKIAASSSDALKKIYNRLGASFAPLTSEIKQYFKLNSGVMVTDVKVGGFFDQIGIPKGTIIAFINGKPIANPRDIDSALLSAQRGTIQILAIAPDGSKVVFNFSLGT